MSAPRGIDLERLTPWFREHVAPVDALGAELIGHGRSNLTYRLFSGDSSWVLRRPPLSHVLPTAHDMKREFRVISALRDTKVPVPDAIALCEDTAVNDAPFYIMSYVAGMVPTDPQVVAKAYDQPTLRRLGEELIDTLVELHALEPASVGLADLGKPQGFIARQVKRFSGQIEQHRTRPVPELEELARRLNAWTPPESGAAIVHGDYRLDNCVIDAAGHIAAVLDWEMATLGDPLADVGMQFMYWGGTGANGQPAVGAGSVTALPGFPTRDEAIRRYAEKSGRDLSNLDFYVVLAYFKLAVIVEGIYARFLEGGTVGAGFEGTGAQAQLLARTGLSIASASTVPSLRG
ncbi:MAG TPA: phosphotransferase family protein [Dehalococcoidia bacterium]|nr:phosphotransferase family protein [Dehalococcoidia bacterium]